MKIKNLSITGMNEASPSASPSTTPSATITPSATETPIPSATPENTQEENQPTGDTSVLVSLLCISVLLAGVIVVAKVRKTVSE